ncbi:hypothetical protein ACHQM5_014139 [Ranunculus cassubicifolius]
MAAHYLIQTLSLFFIFFISHSLCDSLPPLEYPQLSSLEQESVYQVLEAINSTYNWRFNYPDDLCYSSPHGILCEEFTDDQGNTTVHITELSLGYISESSPNPICSSTASLSPSLTSLPFLRKIFYYKCFTETEVSLPGFFSNLSPTVEEIVFIENPSLFGTLTDDKIVHLKNLRRLIFSGTNISGEIPYGVGELIHLEQITLTRNHFSGKIPASLGKLKKLKVLDLSFNGFAGNVTDSVGDITELLKLDLRSNQFNGRIPDGLSKLQRLEFLDLSYNKFGNYGIPLFLAEMTSLKEVYLSGNSLGGRIPDIWKKLGGILGVGLSEMGLIGKIPSSMGMFLRNVNYLSLDNNQLEGTVPVEFMLLESVLNELNLENNSLSGNLPFSGDFKGRIKLSGNPNLCVNQGLHANGNVKVCKKPVNPKAVLLSESSSSAASLGGCSSFVFLIGACLGLFFHF